MYKLYASLNVAYVTRRMFHFHSGGHYKSETRDLAARIPRKASARGGAMRLAKRRMTALVVCVAGVLPVVVLGLQAGGGEAALKQREEARGGDLRRAEKPLIVDNERSVEPGTKSEDLCPLNKLGRLGKLSPGT